MSKLPMTPEVDAMRAINIQGNVIAPEWFNTIVRQTEKQGKKPDVMAIMLLADIVYWYRPRIERDEATGKITGYYRKFNGDYLQKTYGSYAELFGVSEYVIKQAVLTLEALGVVKRILRNINLNGMALYNVLYLQLMPERLQELTIHVHSNCDSEEVQNLQPPIGKSIDPCSKDDIHIQIPPIDYSKTTHITNTREAKAPLSCASDGNFEKFWAMYLKKSGKKDAFKAWRKIKPEMHREILDKLEVLNRVVYSQRAIQYVPMPATWLNGERWNDNPIPEAGCTVKPQTKPALFHYDDDEPPAKNVIVVGQKTINQK